MELVAEGLISTLTSKSCEPVTESLCAVLDLVCFEFIAHAGNRVDQTPGSFESKPMKVIRLLNLDKMIDLLSICFRGCSSGEYSDTEDSGQSLKSVSIGKSGITINTTTFDNSL